MSSGDPKISPINVVFVVFVMGAILFAGVSGRMQDAADASIAAAKGAVTLAIGLIGIMSLWLGFVRVLEAGGMMRQLARLVRPVMVRLFPDVPAEHPAMSAMILNISANMLGLGNAATPFGIKAMVELNRLNPFPGMATNAMCPVPGHQHLQRCPAAAGCHGGARRGRQHAAVRDVRADAGGDPGLYVCRCGGGDVVGTA